MLPVKTIRLQMGELLAADSTYLAPAVNGNKVSLIAAPFTPDENLVLGNLTLATFTGSAAKVAGTGTQGTGVDPATGEQIITILDPAGGWRWECTAAPGAPETIYGIALTDNGVTVLYGVEPFDVPVTIAAVGDQVQVGNVKLTVNSSPIS